MAFTVEAYKLTTVCNCACVCAHTQHTMLTIDTVNTHTHTRNTHSTMNSPALITNSFVLIYQHQYHHFKVHHVYIQLS